MVTSADLVSSKISEKGLSFIHFSYSSFFTIVISIWPDLWVIIILCCFAVLSDLECTYTIICSLVKNLESPEEVLEMVKAIASKVVQQPNDKASLRLKMYDRVHRTLCSYLF